MKLTHFRKKASIIPAGPDGKPDFGQAEGLGSINKAKKRSRQIGLGKVRVLK